MQWIFKKHLQRNINWNAVKETTLDKDRKSQIYVDFHTTARNRESLNKCIFFIKAFETKSKLEDNTKNQHSRNTVQVQFFRL